MSDLPLNSAETAGIHFLYHEFMNHFAHSFGPLPNLFTNERTLKTSMYFMLREIDTLKNQGFLLNTLQQNVTYFQKIATAGCTECQSFESQTFDTQLFLMNLTSFILRTLTRISQMNSTVFG